VAARSVKFIRGATGDGGSEYVADDGVFSVSCVFGQVEVVCWGDEVLGPSATQSDKD
jgi:hypothetical protein